MCFVTYIPQNQGFILTSNRDEHAERPKALPPKKYLIEGQPVFYPKDALAGGSWIASSGAFTICLLNGALVNHVPQPPYRQSRGLVVLDFFKTGDVNRFIVDYQFTGIEPFTLVVVEQKQQPSLHQIRWDGQQLHPQHLDARQAFAWSSVTLYNPDTVQERARWFEAWQAAHLDFTGNQVIDFHLSGGNGDPRNGLIINRNNELITVSVTQIERSTQYFLLHYHDRLNGQSYHYRIL